MSAKPSQPLLERACLKVLRAISPRWRAHTELFVDPYRQWVEWHSGLGEAGFVLYSIARMTRPRVIVEIGSARGNSTCAMALACSENGLGKVYAIDPHRENDWSDLGTNGATLGFLRTRIKRYQLERQCEVMPMTSDAAARTWTQPIDLLFIDGDHTLAGVQQDFELFAPWVKPSGIVALHDSGWEFERPWRSYKEAEWYGVDMGVPKYLASLCRDGYQAVTFLPVPGLTLMHANRGGFDFLRSHGSARETTLSCP
jgi:predicted O-methyltransferase YrrM